MEFRTVVEIPKGKFDVNPSQRMLFVGSCFADNLGRRFWEEQFRVTVNPYGVMYNPASIYHTVRRWLEGEPAREGALAQACGDIPDVVVFTLGTNHVYVLRETDEIVDNCEKRPARLFREEQLSIASCVEFLKTAIQGLREKNPTVRVILTVSPIRYAKYGYPKSAQSKAVLLLAAHEMEDLYPDTVCYFPAYEIMNDDLRDYRFYRPDMLHPSEQAVTYIYERFAETYFSPQTLRYVEEWRRIRASLAHRPLQPDSESYREFKERTREQLEAFRSAYPYFPNNQ